MKWMWSTAFVVVVAASAAAHAQSGKDAMEPAMVDKANASYTGCVEAVNHGGSFVLTHIGEARQGPCITRRRTTRSSSAGSGIFRRGLVISSCREASS